MTRLELPFDGEKGGDIEVKNLEARNLFVNMQLDGIPLDHPVEDEASDITRWMCATLAWMARKSWILPSLEQGTDFMAEVRLTHPGSG